MDIEAITNKFNEGLQAYLGEAEYDFDLESLRLSIRISGTKWSGIVDKPIAKFLIDLDRRLTEELRGAGVDIPLSEHGLIALKIEEGSLEAFLQYSKGILSQLDKMTLRDKILILAGILTALGIIYGPDIIDKLNAVKVEEVHARIEEGKSKERLDTIKAFTTVLQSERELQQPLRALIDKMSPDDKISLPGHKEGVTKEVAKKTLAKGTRQKPKRYYIDHRYIVHDLLTKNPKNWQITLVYGDVAFRAKLLITTEEMTALLTAFNEAQVKGANISPDLHVTAEINEKGITSAEVVGLGAARENSRKLSEVLAIEGALKASK